MNINNLSLTFLEFFQKRKYKIKILNNIVNNANNDLLFINSGIAGIFNEFQNNKINKLATIQTCLRIDGKHNDFENIGKSKLHLSLFRMLGTFVNCNANLEQVIRDIYEFLNTLFELKNKIFVTIHPNDDKTAEIWNNINPNIEVRDCDENIWALKNNGYSGYCTEIMYKSESNQDIEIWNIVIIDKIINNQIAKKIDNIKIDTGGGLERIYSIFEDRNDVYLSSNKFEFINSILQYCSLHDAKIILDSIITINALLNDNIIISNNRHGYILKKIFRRIILTIMNYPLINLSTIIYYGSIFINKIHFFSIIYHQELLSVIRCNKILNKFLLNKQIIESKDIVYLHQTLGIHYQHTIKQANNLKIKAPDIEEVQKLIYTKKLNKNKDIDLKNNIETIFTGYQELNNNYDTIEVDKAIYLDENMNVVQKIKKDQKIIIIPNKTNFYATSGGQIHDIGKIYLNKKILNVFDVKKIKNSILHYCISSQDINIKEIKSIKFIINKSNRVDASNTHTIQHIVIAIIEQLIGMPVLQQSSCIECNSAYFSIASLAILNKNMFNEKNIQEKINKVISKIKININNITMDYAKENNYKKLNCSYSQYVRSIDIIYNNKIISKELCGGTHSINKINKRKIKNLNILNINYNTIKVSFEI